MSSDARKRAEEALARWDALPSGDVDDLAAWDVARDGMERFRALLAEPAPPDGAEVREAAERHLHEAISAWHHDPLSTSRASTVVHFAEGLLSVLAARGGE